MEKGILLTPQYVQRDLDSLGRYKTADVDKLIAKYVANKADASQLRAHILSCQQFHRIYFYVSLKQIKDVNDRMAFIDDNLLFADWWHTDQLISYVSKADFQAAMGFAQKYISSQDPFVRRWGYVMFISRLGHNRASELLPLMKNDDEYYVQMGEAWLIAELAIFEPQAVFDWLSDCNLRYDICGKAIQKICDSFRISQDWKERFKSLRPKLKLNDQKSAS